MTNLPDADVRGKLASGRRRAYVLAGNATVTVEGQRTRYTFQIRQSDPKPGQWPVWWVALLTGPDNERDWVYIGTVFGDGFRTTARSKLAADAPSVVAFRWWAQRWEDERVTVWHEGQCGRCGRRLTVPESIESGLGPVCAGKGK